MIVESRKHVLLTCFFCLNGISWYKYHITSLPSLIIRSSGIPNSEVAFHSCIPNLSKSLRMGRNPERFLLARIRKMNRSMEGINFSSMTRFQSWLLNIFFDSLNACLHVKPGPSNGTIQVCSSYLSYCEKLSHAKIWKLVLIAICFLAWNRHGRTTRGLEYEFSPKLKTLNLPILLFHVCCRNMSSVNIPALIFAVTWNCEYHQDWCCKSSSSLSMVSQHNGWQKSFEPSTNRQKNQSYHHFSCAKWNEVTYFTEY